MYQVVVATLFALVIGFFLGNDLSKSEIAQKCEHRGAFVYKSIAYTCDPIKLK